MKTTERSPSGDTYRPISCDRYSELELAIMHSTPLKLVWREDNVSRAITVLPVDLQTQAGEEYLSCRLPSGETARIRLDRIDRWDPA